PIATANPGEVAALETSDPVVAPQTFTEISDFEDEEIAVVQGVLTYYTTEKIGGIPVEYPNSGEAVTALVNGDVTGFMHAYTLVSAIAAGDNLFDVVPVPKDVFSALLAAFSTNEDMVASFNDFLAGVTQDGTLADMEARWIGADVDLTQRIPYIALNEDAGAQSLVVATSSDSIPFAFQNEIGSLTGYSIELAERFASYLGFNVVFIDMPFADLITSIADGQADIGIANVAITPQRAELVTFTDPYFEETHGILTLR
ncbi:MAG: transporter substrate-binding domain-containing protein, partial [Promicromonosporaceae bacterium]|nr:transporter substrate-binding domain-containing protein [Promicromonosporaceae bacterium]